MAGSSWMRAAAAGLRFRDATDVDLPFLSRIYAATRTEELAPVPWSDEQKAVFLQAQFDAQHAHYRQHYPSALWLVIARGEADIGRLYLDRWPREHRLIDIAILPEHRGEGLGTAILRDLIEEASAAGKPLSIHVEKNNPAMRLYLRLGFRAVGEQGVYDLMRRDPNAVQVKTA
jgi:ribosomal protein S18 acetylase RimI-like enzyme